MSNEPNEPIFVDPNTDDLDAFNDLIGGRAQAKEDTVETETIPLSEDEPDEALDDNSDDTVDGQEEPEESVEKPKKVNRFQERINELTAKAKEAERALEALKTAQTKQDETPKQNTPVVQDDSPKSDALNPDGSDKYPLGEFDPEYIRDMARHTINKEWAAKKEQEAQEQSQRNEQEARAYLQSQWVERLAPVTEQHEDFLEKTMELESTFEGLDAKYSDYLAQTIKSLEHGPEVLYYFANNLAEAQKFVKMGPLNATLALGEINAMFKGNTRKDTRVSNAPPPPQVNKGSNTRAKVAADTDDLDAFSELLFKKRGR